jgi:hypothetical protein
MSVDISKIQSASFLPGLRDLGPIAPISHNIGVVTIPSNGNTTLSPIVIPLPRNDVISSLRVNLTGTNNIGSYWIPLFGMTVIGDVALAESSAANYYIIDTVQSNANGRQLTLEFVNNTSNSVVTTPNLTINIAGHIYEFPWE